MDELEILLISSSVSYSPIQRLFNRKLSHSHGIRDLKEKKFPALLHRHNYQSSIRRALPDSCPHRRCSALAPLQAPSTDAKPAAASNCKRPKIRSLARAVHRSARIHVVKTPKKIESRTPYFEQP
ncbi:hypothetical protein Csa_013674 [Cucumis sativus]|uniref:Uncharacterized protein n=1 Tax=Cucumis sativus TaxID=3659 RepID=A0A0A0LSN9_CUCSA|nr:hypothetical protein Csa_013674 [Cucumis sativus]